MITDKALAAVEKLQRLEKELANAEARAVALRQEYKRYVAELQQSSEAVDEKGNVVSAEPVSVGLDELETDGAFDWSAHKSKAAQQTALGKGKA